MLKPLVVGFSSPGAGLLSRHWTMHTTPLDDDKVTSYYEPFYGHDVEHLALALSALRRRHDSVVFLAGDSSLDNKYWFSSWADAVNGYETVLEPPRMKRDVCYWINEQAEREGKRLGCLNAAVEATSLNDRAWGRLLPQDAFIRDHITEDDVLVVSVGGNDVALSPLLCTAVNLAVLVCCVPRPCLERGACASPPNVNALVDCGCCGCGVPGCVAGLAGWPPGFGYLVDLFKNRVQNYVRRLCAARKPRRVLVCTIYYPEERASGSWADAALSLMRYNVDPGKLQCAIRQIFRHATSRVVVPGVEVVPVPLFEVLDARDGKDYEQRVEPSVVGGRKMAAAFHLRLQDENEPSTRR